MHVCACLHVLCMRMRAWGVVEMLFGIEMFEVAVCIHGFVVCLYGLCICMLCMLFVCVYVSVCVCVFVCTCVCESELSYNLIVNSS